MRRLRSGFEKLSEEVLGSRIGDAGAVRLYLMWSTAILVVLVVVGAPLAWVAKTYEDQWLFDGAFEHDLILFFHLDAEGGLSAGATAGAMLAAAVWGWRWGMATRLARGHAFAAIMCFLAADDWLQFHERAEAKIGVDWQTLYLPVAVAAAVVFVAIDRALPRDRGRAVLLWRIGAVLQAVALVLEFFEWDGDDRAVALYAPMMVLEEIFEFVAPVLWGLALLTAFMIRSPRVVEPLRLTGSVAGVAEPSTLAWFEAGEPVEPVSDTPGRRSRSSVESERESEVH